MINQVPTSCAEPQIRFHGEFWMESQKPPAPPVRPLPSGGAEDEAGVAAAYQFIGSFVAGDIEARDFQRALSSDRSFSALLGEDLYLDLLSSNFDDPGEVAAIRSGLAELLDRLPASPSAQLKTSKTERSDNGT
ncbi:MAG: hypothetical protein ACR2JJ_11715 [Sphingomicrobium sp.]